MQAIQLSMRETQMQREEQRKQQHREEQEDGLGQRQQQHQLQPIQTRQQEWFISATDGASSTSLRPQEYDDDDEDDVNDENNEELQIALRLSMSDAEQR
jgi:hypothetical protein